MSTITTNQLDTAYPLTDAGTTDAGDITVTFRLWADF